MASQEYKGHFKQTLWMLHCICASDGQKLKMLFLHETQDQFFLKKLKVECTHLHVLLQFQNIQNQKIYKFLSI